MSLPDDLRHPFKNTELDGAVQERSLDAVISQPNDGTPDQRSDTRIANFEI